MTPERTRPGRAVRRRAPGLQCADGGDRPDGAIRICSCMVLHDDVAHLAESIGSFAPAGPVFAFVSRVPWQGEAGDWEAAAEIARSAGAEPPGPRREDCAVSPPLTTASRPNQARRTPRRPAVIQGWYAGNLGIGTAKVDLCPVNPAYGTCWPPQYEDGLRRFAAGFGA